jgi:hypothetical protein
MKLHGGRAGGQLVLWCALLLLGACDKGAAPQAEMAPTSAGGASAATSVPPQTGSLPSSAAGPSDGSTSIGGVVTHQGGTAGTGQTAAPTGGDGAASAASK